MPSTREIKRRIGSIKNISQITKAMQMVATSRMRRAQERVEQARPYAEQLRAMVSRLAPASETDIYTAATLIIQRPVLDIPKMNQLRTQTPTAGKLLPVEPPVEEDSAQKNVEYIYEPDPQSLFEALLPRYVDLQVYQAILETLASQWSAQMIAMKNATD